MENIQKENIVSPDEAKAEQEALAVAQEDEIKNQVIEDYSLDPDEDFDLIDNLVLKEMANRKKLSDVIGQKIKWREKATAGKTDKGTESKDDEGSKAGDIETKVREQFEQRDLEELDYPDELKAEIKLLAKIQGVSVRKAAQDPYILFKKEKYDEEQRAEEATVSPKTKGRQVKFDSQTLPEVDMSTPEGRKTWEEYQEFLSKQEAK